MKIYAVLRGFPGLGRVIAGVELLKHFEKKYNAKIKITTYLQGEKYIVSKGYRTTINIDEKDISNVGIISVSTSGEKLIADITSFEPDIVLIDGEPILLHNLKISYPELYIISLLNPFDINNPHNPKSSQDFFSVMYSNADLAIVHGLWREEKPVGFNNFLSVNTIIRNSISEISFQNNHGSIVCILGGGSKSVNCGFTLGTIEIAKQVIDVASMNPKFDYKIYTGDESISYEVLQYIKANNKRIQNITIIDDITDETKIYSEARLVIARAGRNTISELLTLNMPSVIIPTTANYRGSEQFSNCKILESSFSSNIKTHYLKSGSELLNTVIRQLLNGFENNDAGFKPGNDLVIEKVIGVVNKYEETSLIIRN